VRYVFLMVLVVALLPGGACLAQNDAAVVFTLEDDGRWQKADNVHRQAQFPRIHPDGRLWFQFDAPPTAEKVALQIGGQGYDMKKDAAGRWNVVIPRADPGFQIYSFIVDGTRITDPGSVPYYMGGYVSALEYPSPDADFYRLRPVPHGDVRERWFHSAVSGSWRRMFVYTPPGYEHDTDTRYPVLYLQHGGGEDESEWVRSGRANFILDNLIAEGRARPMIIVMNNGFVSRPGQEAAAPGGGYRPGFADAFQEMLLHEVIPEVDATYRTIPGAKHRAVAGLSMGGGQAFYVGLGNTDTFGSVGLFGTGLFGGIRPADGVGSTFDAEEHMPGLLTRSGAFNDALDLFYISVGEQDVRLEATRSAVAVLRSQGLEVEFASFPGDHEWRAWRSSLHDLAQRLFR
jgi:enterochelin esterase-like enzyme